MSTPDERLEAGMYCFKYGPMESPMALLAVNSINVILNMH